jgi:uncharacterized protein
MQTVLIMEHLAIWAGPAALVLAGSALQTATGVGLGLIAGPGLLLILPPVAAIQIAILLNLALTIMLLPGERREVSVDHVKSVGGWVLPGVLLGSGLLLLVQSHQLQIIAGGFVLLAAAQLLISPPAAGRASAYVSRFGGMFAGIMTGALAAPGPLALWTMLASGLATHRVRATLRALFLVSYGLALLISLLMAGWQSDVTQALAWLLPVLAAGAALGLLLRRYASQRALSVALQTMLWVMGAALLLKGTGHVYG